MNITRILIIRYLYWIGDIMNEERIKQFCKDLISDGILYFMNRELTKREITQLELNINEKFDVFMKTGKYE